MNATVGVIGLGVMGKPMARRLVEAGWDVTVHNRSRAAVDELLAAGATDGGSAAGVAAKADIVITMLPDTPDVEEVVLGDGGALDAMRPGGLFIDMSTIAAATAVRIAERASERGIDALDAPVSGGEGGAINGTLSIMCGGTAAAVERARPVFEVLGRRITHVGDAGNGQIVKSCNQVVVGITLQAMAEAVVLARKAGVDPEVMVNALLGGAAQCWALEVRGPSAVRGDFAPGFRSALHHKDLGLALGVAGEHGATLPVTATVRELFGALKATGRGDLDHSALVTIVEDLSTDRSATALAEAALQ